MSGCAADDLRVVFSKKASRVAQYQHFVKLQVAFQILIFISMTEFNVIAFCCGLTGPDAALKLS